MSDKGTVYGHDAIEQALKLWREGSKQARRVDQPIDLRGEYLGALAAVATTLEGCHTMQELCASYYQPAPEVARILSTVIRPASGHILNHDTVEDAAYWLRASELVTK